MIDKQEKTLNEDFIKWFVSRATYDIDQRYRKGNICDIALWLGQYYHDIALWYS